MIQRKDTSTFANVVAFSILFLGTIYLAQSQKEPQYTQYMYNIGSFNPAYVGSTAFPEITTMYRAQWLGIPGAPRTIRLGMNLPLGDERNGLGLNVISDQLGPVTQTYIDLAYSYQFNVSDNTKLSFGMDAGGSLLNVDFSKGSFENPGEPILDQGNINNFYFTIGAGMFLYQQNWYLGVSIPNFLTDGIYSEDVASVVDDKIQFNFIGGYVFQLSESLKFKPAFLINYLRSAPVNINISTNFLINDKFTLGASYRFDSAISALAGFQISNPVFFGVSYDYDTNGLGQYSNGTPEVVLKFSLGRVGGSTKGVKSKKEKGLPKQIDTPRFF
ncbi:MAG: type IX secretion system membrane protein PorP/SprF [Flavobacteriales bacterium]|nr:MAG: type IX secretion system membrane protein PorP/SprF [Flavobacteriales bacterium]